MIEYGRMRDRLILLMFDLAIYENATSLISSPFIIYLRRLKLTDLQIVVFWVRHISQVIMNVLEGSVTSDFIPP
jgi:hypothetical protein